MSLGTSGETLTPGFRGQRFCIDGGDGNQDLFGSALVLERVDASWFEGRVGEFYGEAWLLRVSDGAKAGLLIAVTPRTLGTLDEAMAADGWKSVVVHAIDYPGFDAAIYGPRPAIGGMAFLERI